MAGDGGGLGTVAVVVVAAEDDVFDVVAVVVCHPPATYIA